MSELAAGPGSLQPVDVGPTLPISQSLLAAKLLQLFPSQAGF